eukprot:1589650-Pyramimonas_sp.AAC.1
MAAWRFSGPADSAIPTPPSPEEIQRLSEYFKRATIAADGFHPRHFNMLSRGSLCVLSQVMGVMSIAGST